MFDPSVPWLLLRTMLTGRVIAVCSRRIHSLQGICGPNSKSVDYGTVVVIYCCGETIVHEMDAGGVAFLHFYGAQQHP